MNNTNKKMPRLYGRLSAAADMVHGRVAADIGTDHGYLAAHLILSGKCDRVIASDVNPMPLEKCRTTAELYGVTDKIDTFLADGLDGLPLEKMEVTDIIICGMGGELIARIIEESDYTRRPGVRLILGPMSSVEDLRDYLARRGYRVSEERIAEAAGKLYQLISVEYDGVPYSLSAAERCVGPLNLLRKNDSLLKELIRREISKAAVRIDGKHLGGFDASEDEETAEMLRAALENCV